MKTADAAIALCISHGHLLLQMQHNGGPLVLGTHYFMGAFKNSAVRWDVEACQEEFNRRGMLCRRGERLMRDLQEA
tara:strand:- start:30 stop:257 length:228 start_codon:yes stop_codon:yes gene_type:complete